VSTVLVAHSGTIVDDPILLYFSTERKYWDTPCHLQSCGGFCLVSSASSDST